MLDNAQHLDHFLSERRFGDFGKPLGGEIIRSVAFVAFAFYFNRSDDSVI